MKEVEILRYHNITRDDMLNGVGVRVVLWFAGCEHKCDNCHNPITWDYESGLEFCEKAKEELFKELKKDYIAGVTFSGGDPLHPKNRAGLEVLMSQIKDNFPNKTIWLYTGYKWEEISKDEILFKVIKKSDVVVDGKFEEALKDISYKWAGSKNQKIIDVQKSIREGHIVNYVHN